MTFIIENTLLESRLKGNSCFDKEAMNLLFPYPRRKDFLLFLVQSGYIPYNNTYICESNHKLFDVYDLDRTIMSYL